MTRSHAFTATQVAVRRNPLFVAFGRVEESAVPEQSLLISRDDEDASRPRLHLELNSQSNACYENSVKWTELSDSELQIALDGEGLRSGAFDRLSDERVLGLRVAFTLSDEALRELRDGLRELFGDVIAFRYVGRRLSS